MNGYRRWAVIGMVSGAVTSIAANVAHTFVPPPHWPVGREWRPEVGAVLGAAAWPTFLLIASEVLSRKRWASQAARVVGTGAVLVVALVAAVISYQHLHALLQHYREADLSAAIGPLAIDGLMIVCSVALVAKDASILADDQGDDLDARVDALLESVPDPRCEHGRPVRFCADPVHFPPVEVPATAVAAEPAKSPQDAPETRPVPVAAARQDKPSRVTVAADPPADGEDGLLAAARAVAEQVAARGERLTRAVLLAGLREAGHACGNTKAGHLLAQLRPAQTT